MQQPKPASINPENQRSPDESREITASSHSLVAMAHGLPIHMDEARRTLARMTETQPNYDPINSWRNYHPAEEIMDTIAAAIRRARFEYSQAQQAPCTGKYCLR